MRIATAPKASTSRIRRQVPMRCQQQAGHCSRQRGPQRETFSTSALATGRGPSIAGQPPYYGESAVNAYRVLTVAKVSVCLRDTVDGMLLEWLWPLRLKFWRGAPEKPDDQNMLKTAFDGTFLGCLFACESPVRTVNSRSCLCWRKCPIVFSSPDACLQQ